MVDLESALAHSVWVEIKHARFSCVWFYVVYCPPSTTDAFWAQTQLMLSGITLT